MKFYTSDIYSCSEYTFTTDIGFYLKKFNMERLR